LQVSRRDRDVEMHVVFNAVVNKISVGLTTVATVTACPLVMVALRNRADHYIFMLWFVLLLFFFPRLISAATDWTSAILPHIVWH